MNRITGPGTAIIAGKPTGLAGCLDSASCNAAATCIRADARLSAHRAHFAPVAPGLRVASCSVFIRTAAEQVQA